LADILSFSIERWGIEQAFRYRILLQNAVDSLLDFPGLGEAYRLRRPAIHSFRAEQHRIYYSFDLECLSVIRVLHSAMDPARHLP
jgi:toxin ParE1/3/4